MVQCFFPGIFKLPFAALPWRHSLVHHGPNQSVCILVYAQSFISYRRLIAPLAEGLNSKLKSEGGPEHCSYLCLLLAIMLPLASRGSPGACCQYCVLDHCDVLNANQVSSIPSGSENPLVNVIHVRGVNTQAIRMLFAPSRCATRWNHPRYQLPCRSPLYNPLIIPCWTSAYKQQG